VIGSMV